LVEFPSGDIKVPYKTVGYLSGLLRVERRRGELRVWVAKLSLEDSYDAVLVPRLSVRIGDRVEIRFFSINGATLKAKEVALDCPGGSEEALELLAEALRALLWQSPGLKSGTLVAVVLEVLTVAGFKCPRTRGSVPKSVLKKALELYARLNPEKGRLMEILGLT